MDRATASILRQRNPDFSYIYGEYTQVSADARINRPAGSLGRSQACNLAMRLWGDERGDRRRAEDVARSPLRPKPLARHGPQTADPARVVVPGGGLLLLLRPLLRRVVHRTASRESERRPYQDHLAHVLLPLQEKDGSWWDFPLYDYHQQYGTAFALMSLQRCRGR